MEIDLKKYPKPQRIRPHIAPNHYFKYNKLNPDLEFYPPVYKDIDWKTYFKDNKPPQNLDIGCGMGGFLLESANENIHQNYLGIEVRKAPVQWIQSVIDGESILNCAVLNYSVVNGLPFIENQSINHIYYFFPDPWFKKRHKKRRAFNLDFLNECHRVMMSDGTLFLQTDIEEVHNYHIETLLESEKFNFEELTNLDNWLLKETDQEKICNKANFPFWKLICTKK